jgi:excisionase family DNA binding protein
VLKSDGVGMSACVVSCKIFFEKDGLEDDIADGVTCLHAYTPANAATNSASASIGPGLQWWALGLWLTGAANDVDRSASLERVMGSAAAVLGGDMSARPGMETTRFLSVDDAAELLSISKRTIYGFVQQGRIPYRKAGRRVLFLESELLEWTKPSGHHNPISGIN